MDLYRSRLALSVLVAALTSGCTTMGAWDSQEAIALAPSDSLIMASDVAHVLGVEYAPGQTTFAMASDGRFGSALENKLRGAGFAVSALSDNRPVHVKELAYVLDELGRPGTYRLGVRVSPAYRLDLLYRTDSTGQLERGSGATVLNGTATTQLPPITRPIVPLESAFASNDSPTVESTPATSSMPVEAISIEDGSSSPSRNWIVQGNGNTQVENIPDAVATAAAETMDASLSEQIAADDSIATEENSTASGSVPGTAETAAVVDEPAESQNQDSWDLHPGPLRQQLLAWQEDSGWSITWAGNQDLMVEVSHTFYGPVDEAVIQVVTAFSRAGADIRLDHIAGNRQMIVRTGS